MQNEPDESIIITTMDNDLEGMKNAIKLGIDINTQDFFWKNGLTLCRKYRSGTAVN